MAFNDKEQQIIKWGLQNGKSQQEVTQAITNFRTGVLPQKQEVQEPSFLEGLKNDLNTRVERTGGILSRPDSSIVEKGVQTFGQGAGLAANAIEQTAMKIPGVKQVVQGFSAGVKWLSESTPIKAIGNVIGSNKTVQDVTHLYDTDQNFKDSVDAVANSVRLTGDVQAIADVATLTKNVANKLLSHNKAKLADVEAGFEQNGTTANTVKMQDKYIASGDYKPEAVYSNPSAKIYQPAVAKQVVSDGANNFIEHGFQELANKYTSMFGDFTKVTPEQVLNNGKLMATEIKTGLSGLSSGLTDTLKVGLKGITDSKLAGNITKDILPTTDRIVNTEVTKALDLTQGDVKNISLSTGNDVGKFMADNNLIHNTLPETIKAVDDFFRTNYDAVRVEIKKVSNIYKAKDVPRYEEALKAIKKQINDTPGLQKANQELDALLKKKNITLENVQRAKELLDEHFSLYKATGDVKESVAKAGLDNIRANLRSFIETEVKKSTGADINKLNNNVATARSIQDAVETRSTRGLTRATISAADVITFLTGSGFTTPLGGALAVLIKKIYQSPTFKLKLSKWLDTLSDAKRLKIQNDLKKGIVPPEIKAQIKPLKSRLSPENKDITIKTATNKTVSKKTRNVSIG